MVKIYVASSWRNRQHSRLVTQLRGWGHEVYDFRQPPGSDEDKRGFHWSMIDPDWIDWTATEYRDALATSLARRGFERDITGMRWADTGVLLLPCGRSSHLEIGWMAGAGKRTVILTRDGEEPELMSLLATTICVNVDELWRELERG